MLVKKLTVLFLAAVMAVSAAAVFAGCTPDEPTPPPGPVETYEFDFVGSGEYNDGKEYTVHIRGSEADDTFALTIDELSVFELDGTYTFVDGKGYKLYFEDVGDQFTYTDYDTATQTFSFRYNLDLGEALGSRRIELPTPTPISPRYTTAKGSVPRPRPLRAAAGAAIWGSSK